MGTKNLEALRQPLEDRIITISRASGLTVRAYHRILKLSRTITHLVGSEQVLVSHLAEALQYQPRDMV